MRDDFMEYMLLFDEDEEDEPKPGSKPGCGCLPSVLLGLIILAVIVLLGR